MTPEFVKCNIIVLAYFAGHKNNKKRTFTYVYTNRRRGKHILCLKVEKPFGTEVFFKFDPCVLVDGWSATDTVIGYFPYCPNKFHDTAKCMSVSNQADLSFL